MEKEMGQIKFTKTDDGFRLDFSGELSKMAGCNCGCDDSPDGSESKANCCEPGEKEKP